MRFMYVRIKATAEVSSRLDCAQAINSIVSVSVSLIEDFTTDLSGFPPFIKAVIDCNLTVKSLMYASGSKPTRSQGATNAPSSFLISLSSISLSLVEKSR